MVSQQTIFRCSDPSCRFRANIFETKQQSGMALSFPETQHLNAASQFAYALGCISEGRNGSAVYLLRASFAAAFFCWLTFMQRDHHIEATMAWYAYIQS